MKKLLVVLFLSALSFAQGGLTYPSSTVTWLDNCVITGPVDGSGNPAYTSVSSGTATLLGATTNIVLSIGGLKTVVNSNLTTTLTNSALNYVYLTKDTTNPNPVNADFLKTTNAPVFGNGYAAPSTASATSSNPVFWFNPTVNSWQSATSNGGAFSNNPVVFIGVIYTDSGGAALASGYWPPFMTPWKVMELFGQGTDGSLRVNSSTTNINTWKQYSALAVTGTGTLSETAQTSGPGVVAYSQAPILVAETAAISANGKGASGPISVSGAGTVANAGSGYGGGGGGGGGSTNNGGAGAPTLAPWAPFYPGGTSPAANVTMNAIAFANGGTAGSSAGPTAGGTGPNSALATGIPPLGPNYISLAGGSGGGGSGDGGAASGGTGGAGGGMIYLRAPGLVVASGASITANGSNGGNGAGTNGAGGGGGGGGGILAYVGYYSNAGTVTANAGSGGTHAGTGKDGGNGGAGIVQITRIY